MASPLTIQHREREQEQLGNLCSSRMPIQKKTGCSLFTNQVFASETNSPRQLFSFPESSANNKMSQFIQPRCKNCQLWNQWAILQQRELLSLQQQLMEKQEKMISLLSKQHSNIASQQQRIKQLEKNLNEEKTKIVSLEKEIEKINKQCEELEAKKVKCETPKKPENSVENEFKGKIVNLELGSIEKTEKYQNLVKTSAITTKTEGWGCEQTLKKEKIEARSVMTKRSDLQRCLFQNQTLKDYNSTLLDRLTAARYKKSIY